MSAVAYDVWESCVEDLTLRMDVWVVLIIAEVITGRTLEDVGPIISCVLDMGSDGVTKSEYFNRVQTYKFVLPITADSKG